MLKMKKKPEERTELEQKQFEEAIERMKMVRLFDSVIKDFREGRCLYRSEDGFLFWLDEEEQKRMADWEEEYEGMVYHVIKNITTIGTMYSIFYVSKHAEEWEMDRIDLKDGYPFVYVMVVPESWTSEFGNIQIKPLFGGLKRIE